MTLTTPCLWIVALGLVSLPAIVAEGAEPPHSPAAAGSSPVESRASHHREPTGPAGPRVANPAAPPQSRRPAGIPGQAPVPPQRVQALEERLRQGRLDQPIAQGPVSDRLEQFHRGAAVGSPGEASAAGPPVR